MIKITLCGSTRFKDEYDFLNKQLSQRGYLVYSVAYFHHADNIELPMEVKVSLDLVHKLKIEESDIIVFINKNGYWGDSTKKEYDYAKSLNKIVMCTHDYTEVSQLFKSILEYKYAIKKSTKELKTFIEGKSVNNLDKVLKELHTYLDSCKKDKYAVNDGLDSGIDLLGPDHKAINTFQILKYLKRYRTKGFKKSELRSDLLKIIHYTLFELEATRIEETREG